MYIQDTAFCFFFPPPLPSPAPLPIPPTYIHPYPTLFSSEQLNPYHHLHRIRNPRTRRIRKLISRTNRHIGIINFRRRRRRRSRQRKVRSLQYRGTDRESRGNVNNMCDVAIDVGEVYTRGGNKTKEYQSSINTSLKKKEGGGEGNILTRTQCLGADKCAQTAHEQRLERCQTKRDGDIIDGLWVALGENFDFDICVGCSVLWRVEADDAGLCGGGQERGGCGEKGGGGTHFLFLFYPSGRFAWLVWLVELKRSKLFDV